VTSEGPLGRPLDLMPFVKKRKVEKTLARAGAGEIRSIRNV